MNALFKTYILLSCLLMLFFPMCDQRQEPSYSENTYRNPKIGLKLVKPNDWLFVSEQQSLENRKNAELNDEQLEQEVQDEANLPTVSIAKYPEPYPTINPTVQIKHIVKPSPELQPEDVLRELVTSMQNGFFDFEVKGSLKATEVSGQNAAQMEAEFLMKTETGGMFTVYSRMWVVERGDDLFIIGMSGPATGDDASEEEFSTILLGIEIN